MAQRVHGLRGARPRAPSGRAPLVNDGASFTLVMMMSKSCVADWFGAAAVVVEPQRDRGRAEGVGRGRERQLARRGVTAGSRGGRRAPGSCCW